MSTTPATALARVEATGARLRIDQAGEVVMEGPAAPPGLLAELRTCWPGLVRLLRLRAALGVPPPPPGWLSGIAAAIRDALVAGATQESDGAGWLYLAAPDGRRLVVAPDTSMDGPAGARSEWSFGR